MFNIIYAQSGGMTPVINNSAASLIRTAQKHSDRINKIYAAKNGIIGLIENRIVDITKLSEKELSLIENTSGGIFGTCRYKLKEDVDFKIASLILPVKKRSYPTYLHCYSVPDEDEKPSALHAGMNNYEYVKIVVEGIEGCYLNKNKEGKLCTNKLFKESSYIRNAVNKKLKSLEIDKIDLRDSSSLKELEKLTFVEELTLWGLDKITNWDILSKGQEFY